MEANYIDPDSQKKKKSRNPLAWCSCKTLERIINLRRFLNQTIPSQACRLQNHKKYSLKGTSGCSLSFFFVFFFFCLFVCFNL